MTLDIAAEMESLVDLWVAEGCPAVELHRPGHWGDIAHLGPDGDVDDIALAMFEVELRERRDEEALERIRKFRI